MHAGQMFRFMIIHILKFVFLKVGLPYQFTKGGKVTTKTCLLKRKFMIFFAPKTNGELVKPNSKRVNYKTSIYFNYGVMLSSLRSTLEIYTHTHSSAQKY